MKKVSPNILATSTDSTVLVLKNPKQLRSQHYHQELQSTAVSMPLITVNCVVVSDLCLQGHCSFAEGTMLFAQRWWPLKLLQSQLPISVTVATHLEEVSQTKVKILEAIQTH
jgi:hypothetical protein